MVDKATYLVFPEAFNKVVCKKKLGTWERPADLPGIRDLLRDSRMAVFQSGKFQQDLAQGSDQQTVILRSLYYSIQSTF